MGSLITNYETMMKLQHQFWALAAVSLCIASSTPRCRGLSGAAATALRPSSVTLAAAENVDHVTVVMVADNDERRDGLNVIVVGDDLRHDDAAESNDGAIDLELVSRRRREVVLSSLAFASLTPCAWGTGGGGYPTSSASAMEEPRECQNGRIVSGTYTRYICYYYAVIPFAK